MAPLLTKEPSLVIELGLVIVPVPELVKSEFRLLVRVFDPPRVIPPLLVNTPGSVPARFPFVISAFVISPSLVKVVSASLTIEPPSISPV